MRFVAERIDPGAYVGFYLYSYNFVDLKNAFGVEYFQQTAESCTSLFFDGVRNEKTRRAGRVAMGDPPDGMSFTPAWRRRDQFADLDRRRLDAVKICRQYSFSCRDISSYIYERAIIAGRKSILRR